MRTFVICYTMGMHRWEQLIYINVCCFEAIYKADVFPLVKRYYADYELGFPKLPTMLPWVHVIPAHTSDLKEETIIFAHQVDISVYWRVFYSRRMERERDTQHSIVERFYLIS